MEFEKKWQEKFNKVAKDDREDHQISLASKEGLNAYIKYFFTYFKPYIQKDLLLLDLGCGPATFSKIFSQQGFKVYAVDYSQPIIEIAKKRSGGQKIDFQVADVYNLPFENDYFDIVICLGVFQYVEKPEEALREIRRVLKNGGILTITTLNRFSFASLVKKEKIPPLKRYNPYKFKTTLKGENFNKIRLKGVYFCPRLFEFLTDFIIRLKIYKLFNLFFPVFTFISHSFYIEGRKSNS